MAEKKIQKKHFLYEIIAEEIELKIHQKVFNPGEKLPSIRELHQKLNKSVTTVSKAYELLESKGLILARDRSGYFVTAQYERQIQRPEKSHSNLFPKLIRRSGIVEDVLGSLGDESKVQLGAAYISPKLFPFGQYTRILKKLTPDLY